MDWKKLSDQEAATASGGSPLTKTPEGNPYRPLKMRVKMWRKTVSDQGGDTSPEGVPLANFLLKKMQSAHPRLTMLPDLGHYFQCYFNF